MYTADKRLLLTEDDKVVEEGDPKGVKLLVAEGGQLSDEDAEKYGLSSGKKSEEPDDPNRPKEIRMGEAGTTEAMREEEEINLGEGEESHVTKAATKTSVKASKKASKK